MAATLQGRNYEYHKPERYQKNKGFLKRQIKITVNIANDQAKNTKDNNAYGKG